MATTNKKRPARAALDPMRPSQWKPRLRLVEGTMRYCSPGCGHGCTLAAHKKAKERGAALAKRLGKGWKVDVWENGGWHYAVFFGKAVDTSHRGLIDIHATHVSEKREPPAKGRRHSVSYWAALQTAGTFGQLCSGHHSTPEACLREVKQQLAETLEQVLAATKAIEGIKP